MPTRRHRDGRRLPLFGRPELGKADASRWNGTARVPILAHQQVWAEQATASSAGHTAQLDEEQPLLWPEQSPRLSKHRGAATADRGKRTFAEPWHEPEPREECVGASCARKTRHPDPEGGDRRARRRRRAAPWTVNRASEGATTHKRLDFDGCDRHPRLFVAILVKICLDNPVADAYESQPRSELGVFLPYAPWRYSLVSIHMFAC